MEHVYLVTRAVWVREYESRANDVERGIYVHGVGVFEAQCVYPDTLLGKMPAHPFYTHEIGDLARKESKMLITLKSWIWNFIYHPFFLTY